MSQIEPLTEASANINSVKQEKNHRPTALWQRIALGAILLVSAFLNFFQLGQNHYGDITTSVSGFYASAVKSMAMSWHNFFFVAFDPAGFLAIDKPPLGFWIQTLSVRIFGFSEWSLLLPEALAGLGSVAILYLLVRRVFGPHAGLIAAFALALTPISVAISRNNAVDSLLVLTLLFAAWTLSLAVERGSERWLLLCALLVGLGFNIKMLEAYLVLPAFALTYLLCAPRSLRVRLLHLVLAGLVLLVISGSWITVVDLIPAGQRPYVSSTQHNSELELA
ncbi:MAG TPA: glycosyltransferase family 39 protein, partial [Ktedonobacteraceae bacterium]|nr:glycosyltransferase family 39 protein [Ktedonobacteraceae bacterium]